MSQILGNQLTLVVKNIWSEDLTSSTIKLSSEKQFIQQTFIKCSYAKKYAMEMQMWVTFHFLPLRSSHSSKGGLKENTVQVTQ